MNNIFEYLKNRKNIPFSIDPFNEVDGLALSLLIYTKYENILDENSYEDIKVVNKEFWKIHSEKEIKDSSSYTKMAPFIMKEMAKSIRYKGTKLRNYVSNISLKETKQFAAITIELPDGSDYVAYRGTDGTVAGWSEDFMFSYTTTQGQEDAVLYLNKYHHDNNRPIRVGGHSKGGNLAVYAAVKSCDTVRNKIIKVYSNDGPGFKLDFIESKQYKEILPKIVSVIPHDCMIGVMMNNQYQHIITESNAKLIYQHDGFSWLIEDNHFKQVDKRSDESIMFEKVLNDWLIKFDETKRQKILNTVVTLYLDENAKFKDNEKLSPSFFAYMIVNSTKIDKRDRELLISSITDFFNTTESILSDEFKQRYTGFVNRIENQIRTKIEKGD